MTGPDRDEEAQEHLVIQVDAGTYAVESRPRVPVESPEEEPAEAGPPPEQPGLLHRYRYGLFAAVVLALLAGAAYAIGAALYDPQSRLPNLVFATDEPLYGMNAAVAAELDLVRETFSEPGALDLAPAGEVFRLPLPRTVADRLYGRRDEVATIFGADSPAGEFRFLMLSDGSGGDILAIEAPLGMSRRDQPTGIFLALDAADPGLAPLVQALEAAQPALRSLPSRELSSDGYYIFGPYQGAHTEALRDRVTGNAVMSYLAEELKAAESDVSMASPALLVVGGPSRGTINALYHPARGLIMEPLWGESTTASLAHEMVHAYLDTVADDPDAVLTSSAAYFEDAHPVLHGRVVGDLYQRLGREGRAEETLAFLVGALAAGQTKTVETQRLLQSPGNLALSEAVLYSDIRMLVEAGLLPECMLPRDDARGEITHEYYDAAEAACAA